MIHGGNGQKESFTQREDALKEGESTITNQVPVAQDQQEKSAISIQKIIRERQGRRESLQRQEALWRTLPSISY